MLGGLVEVDETYIGGYREGGQGGKGKAIVMGMVEKGGEGMRVSVQSSGAS